MQLTTQLGLIAGVALALAGEIQALRSLKDLKRLTAFSALAQAGYLLAGISLGTPLGVSGALLLFVYQGVARVLWFWALNLLARDSGGWELEKLTSAGIRRPTVALLLGFSLFAALGLTPFQAPPGRAFILFAVIESGNILLALGLALAGLAAAIYTVRVVHAVCLENRYGFAPVAGESGSVGSAWKVLGALLALACVFPQPLTHLFESLAQGLTGVRGVLPDVEGHWTRAALVPYAGAFALYAVARWWPSKRDLAALALAGATVAAAWLEPGLTPLQSLFTMLYALIGALVVIYSVGYMSHEEGVDHYWFFLFVMIATLIGLASADNLGGFASNWEIMTFSSYMLVIHKRTQEALDAGVRYFVMCVGGALFMQVGLLTLQAGALQGGLDQLAPALQSFGPAGAAGIALLLLAGFTVKAGFFPLHSWLPAAHPVAPSSISAPLSGILTKAGVFGVVLVVPVLASQQLAGGYGQATLTLLTVMAAITFALGEGMALVQTDVKRMLAYSTLAQIGQIGLTLSLGTWAATTGALAHVLSHAVMKDLLFLAAGGLILRAGTQQMSGLAGLGRAMPFTGTCMVIGLVGIMGLPPMGAFFTKFLMLKAAVDAGQIWMAALILTGTLVACAYYGRLIKLLIFTKYTGPKVEELPLTMRVAVGLLTATAVLAGLFPAWWVSLAVPAANALFPGQAGLLPNLAISWPLPVLFVLLGVAGAIWYRADLKKSGTAATAGLLLALAAHLATSGSWGALQWWFATLVLALGACNMAYSTGYMSHSHTPWRFFAVFLTMIAGLVGMASVNSLLAFFLFWEIMSSWPLFFAIIHEETPAALKEGTKYFYFNMAGASFLFLGILWTGFASGGFAFDDVARAVAAGPTSAWLPGLCLMGIGMLMKAAMLPVRIDWQMHPPTAPTPVSGYISAMLLKSGPFGILLVRYVLAQGAGPEASQALDTALYVGAWIGGVTILYAGIQALLQTGIKEMLIYSTVSQIGYIVLGVCLGTSLGATGGMLHLFNHMLFKDLAFLCAGALMFASHAHNLEELGGIGRKMPVTLLCFATALFSAAGMPPFNGFNSKLILYYALIERGEVILAIIAILTSVITLAYFLKFLHGAFFGQLSPLAHHAKEVGPAMRIPMLLLAGLCLITGVFPGLGLIPIAGIEQSLGLTPPPVNLTGITSGFGAGNMTLLSFMILLVGGGVWFGVSRLTQRVRRTAIHTCGETSVDPLSTSVSAGNLYAAPLKLLSDLSKGYFSAKRLGGEHD